MGRRVGGSRVGAGVGLVSRSCSCEAGELPCRGVCGGVGLMAGSR